MANVEKSSHFNPSPEIFTSGREVMLSFSPNNKLDEEPDYELSERGRNRLLEAIKTEPDSQAVLLRENSERLHDRMRRPNQWEPFTQQSLQNHKLLNYYAGPYENVLELHRPNTEQFLQIAGMDGKIFLKDAILKKGRHEVGRVPYGWQIGIDGEKIQSELEAKDEKKPMDEQFAVMFEKSLRKALTRIMIKENLGLEFKGIDAYIATFALPLLVSAGVSLSDGIENGSIALQYATIANYIALHITSRVFRKPLGIEGNRIIRGILFINHKGKELVRLRKENSE